MNCLLCPNFLALVGYVGIFKGFYSIASITNWEYSSIPGDGVVCQTPLSRSLGQVIKETGILTR